MVHSGIGGTAASLEIEGIPVFAKRVPLTDLEMRPENVMSTGNTFGLPAQFHYGLVSLGFGAWRELASHTMTTNWVLARQCESFPLMYHSRVLTGQSRVAPTSEVQKELSQMVEYWEGASSVRLRLKEVEQSTAHVVLFLEHIPQNLLEWLNMQLAIGEEAISSACAMLERSLSTEVSFMNSNGLLHLDAHSKNILTDGQRLYFADFGLAVSPRFELSDDEADFVKLNRLHDSSHTIAQFVNWLVTALGGATISSIEERNEFVRRCANGDQISFEPPAASVIIKRYAPVAVIFNDFYRELYLGRSNTPFPSAELEQAWRIIGLGHHEN